MECGRSGHGRRSGTHVQVHAVRTRRIHRLLYCVGRHTDGKISRNIDKGKTAVTATVKRLCGQKEQDGFRASGSSKLWNKVYEYTPAPGQFINETSTIGGMTGNETSPEAAVAWATQRLKDKLHVSLGSFGGYIIVGFDHSIPNSGNQYDFCVQGNAFDGSSEPGIVWVMQDINGNGLPDDEWYELKGSEAGKEETIQNFEVTYYRPEGKNGCPMDQFRR